MALPRLVASGAARRRGARVLLAGLLVWLAAASASAACMPSAQLAPDAQLLELERGGRAQPRACAARLAALAEQAQADPALRVEALLLQGWLLAGLSDHDGVAGVVRQLDPAAPAVPLAAAAALLVRARLAEQVGDTARAAELADKALLRLPADATPLNRLRVTSAQSHIRNSASRLEDAIRLDHQALKLADALAEPWRQAEVRNDLAYNYFQAGQPEQARRLNDEALQLARLAGDDVTLAHVYTVRGIVLDALGDKRAERDALQAALDHARRAGAKYEESLYLANLADHYLKKGDYATALRHAKAALPLTRELKNLGGETVALANIGLAQIALHDVEAGKRNLLASIAIDERRGSITGVADSYAEMGQYLERAGDARGAIAAWQRQRVLSTQLLAHDEQQAILEMQAQFEREQRERELALLQRDGAIKTEQLRARELQQRLGWLLAVCGAPALGVVLLGVWRLRQANRQLAHSNAQLQQQASIDPLTGLANRRRLQEAMRRLGADGAFCGSVFLADLDHFKRINDQHGHAAGDAVLVDVAQRLRRMLREDDLIVRWGGEEFVVIARALDADAVQALAQRMLDAIGATPCQHDGQPIAVTVSIGYATFPIEPGLLQLSWERAIGLVDTAMYLAKAHGRNRAYGVRMLRARDAQHLDTISRALETAWMAGEVALTPHTGPQGRVLPAQPAWAQAA